MSQKKIKEHTEILDVLDGPLSGLIDRIKQENGDVPEDAWIETEIDYTYSMVYLCWYRPETKAEREKRLNKLKKEKNEKAKETYHHLHAKYGKTE